MKRIVGIVFILVLITSCDDFITEKDKNVIKEIESADYVTLQDIAAGNRSLVKGTRIKIKVRTDKDWVKVYGYRSEIDELISEQTLVLYLFKEDFKKEQFNTEFFIQKLYERIKKVDQVKR